MLILNVEGSYTFLPKVDLSCLMESLDKFTLVGVDDFLLPVKTPLLSAAGVAAGLETLAAPMPATGLVLVAVVGMLAAFAAAATGLLIAELP